VELKAGTVLLVAMAFLYCMMAATLTCGCSMHVGDAPCLAYARAVEARMVECELLPDEWYEQKLRGIYDQCDSGPLGLTFVDSDDASSCVGKVRAATCERMKTGAPTCLTQVQL
jgi:hypothetical protein